MGPRRLGFYSYDLGACPDAPCWHLIALNSELCLAPGGCGPAADPDAPGPGNRMYTWLRRDLARHPAAEYPCTLAYWHHPLFSSGRYGNNPQMADMWRLLNGAGAEIVLTGHEHHYERFAPQDADGRFDPQGIREFVVGTGGTVLRPAEGGQPNSEVRESQTWGVLKLTLRASSYDWEFVPIDGQSFRDFGSGDCR
jgi:hypothetical protein